MLLVYGKNPLAGPISVVAVGDAAPKAPQDICFGVALR